jgi:hypothetical protein
VHVLDCSTVPPQPLAFPALVSVGTDLRVEDTIGFTGVSLASLVSVGTVPDGHPIGSLIVEDNQTVASLALPELEEVILDLVVRGNPALDSAAIAGALSGVTVGRARTICGNRADEPGCP